MDGILLIDKEKGITSFKAIEKVKKKLGLKKIGHTGTLDPFATGLLIACVDNATKIVPIFIGLDKVYEAEIVFGEERETDDITSFIINRSENIPEFEDIEGKISEFIGDIEQVPPKYSAIKINGQRAYKLARKGEEPLLKSRKVSLYYAKIIDYRKPILKIVIHCSTGFYVRSFARDLGRALGSYAYVSSLRRIKVGIFSIMDSKKIDDIDNKDIIDVKSGVSFLNRIDIDEKIYNRLSKNFCLDREYMENIKNTKNEKYLALYFKDLFLGIIDSNGKFIYRNNKNLN